MDDRTFTAETASAWIAAVESENAKIRESDIYPRLRKWVKSVLPTDLLEIGCGQGICAAQLNLAGQRYIGVEPSIFLVERARQLHQSHGCRFVLGNSYDMPFPAESFDAAFSVSVWHLLADLDRAALEMSRVLRPHGRFLMITANPAGYEAWTDAYSNATLEGRRFQGYVHHPDGSVERDVLYLHPLSDILEALRCAELEIEGTEPFRGSEKSGGPEVFIAIHGRKTGSRVNA